MTGWREWLSVPFFVVEVGDTMAVRGKLLRLVALSAVLFLGVAECHEAVLAAWQSVSCDGDARDSAPAHHSDTSCAFCVLAGTFVLVTPSGNTLTPETVPTTTALAQYNAPLIRDTACFPHLRRAPPAL